MYAKIKNNMSKARRYKPLVGGPLLQPAVWEGPFEVVNAPHLVERLRSDAAAEIVSVQLFDTLEEANPSPKKAKSAPAAKTEEPKAEEPKAEEPKAEEPKAEEPKVDEPKVDEPKVDEPKAEEPKVDEPKVDEPKAEEPKKAARKRARKKKSTEAK